MKKEASNILETLKNNAGKRGGMRLKDRSFDVKNEWDAEELAAVALSPQAIICVGVILALEVEVVSEKELFAAYVAAEEQFASSKQSAWQVFSYYRKKIVEAGFLTEILGEPVSE